MTIKAINRILGKFEKDGSIFTKRSAGVLDTNQYHRARQRMNVHISENRKGTK